MSGEVICIEQCKHKKSKKKNEMIRCILCTIWHHTDCVGVEEGEVGAWTCFKCRNIADEVRELKSSLSEITKLCKTMNENTMSTLTPLVDLKKSNEELLKENAQFQSRQY